MHVSHLTGTSAKVSMYTDNKSITHLDTPPTTSYHIMRWRLAIQYLPRSPLSSTIEQLLAGTRGRINEFIVGASGP